jgi:integrase/recombinase XerD
MSIIKTYQAISYIGKDGTAPIYVSFYVKNKQKIAIPTKVKCLVENFDSASGKITNKEKGYKDKNLIIDRILARVNNIMVKFRLNDKILTKDAFWKMYKRPDNFDTFFAYVRDYWKKHPYEIEFTTLKTHTDVLNKLELYKSDLHFDEISEDFIKEYKIHLSKKLKNKESTIAKNMAVLKKYIRRAIKEGYIDTNPFENMVIKRNIAGKFSYLTEEELNILIEKYNSKTLPKTYQDTLEFFLFLCFSSLHITDAKRLLIEQISTKSFTYYRIKNRNSKPEPIVVPLSSPAKKILKKVIKKRTKGKIWEHVIADQKVNEYIKTIIKECEIKKDVSSKTGRHTFATYYLSKTKDITSLKEIMGHSDIRETLIYAHVLEETKQSAIKMFDTFII